MYPVPKEIQFSYWMDITTLQEISKFIVTFEHLYL